LVAKVFRVYGDESGIHQGAIYCTVAGLIGTPGQWSRFEAKWRAAPKEFFNPKARLSHENPYRKWTQQKDDAFIEALLTTIDDHKVWTVGCSIKIADFMALSYGERCWLSGGEVDEERKRWKHHGAPNVPYHVGVAGLVADAHTIRKDEVTRLHFVLEDQSPLSEFAKLTWNRWKRLERKEKGNAALLQLGSMAFASSDEERS
jgi:hypothetical protein